MTKPLLLGLTIVAIVLPAATTQAATIYKIDINDASNSVTESGWTGLDATYSTNGGSVTVDGVTFAPASADGARLRGSVASPSPDALMGDFVYDDGNGQAVILLFGGPGDLQAGTWEVGVYFYDADHNIGSQKVGYRTNSTETMVDTAVAPNASGPAITFTFESNGSAAYDVFVRENTDRTRLNAVTLTLIPEPGTLAVLALGALAACFRRKRR